MRVLTASLCLCLLGGSVLAQVPPGTTIPPSTTIPPGKTKWLPAGPDTERGMDRVDRKTPNEGEPDEIPEVDAPDREFLRVSLDVVGYPSVVPTRLPPGGQGKLVVTLVLKEHVVITPDTPFELRYLPQQGAVSLGAYTLRPARQTLDDGPLFGEMVWDETAVLEVPVRVAPGAEQGEHRVAVRAEFELKDARSGFTKGRFRRPIPVGILVEGPAVSSGAGSGSPAPVADASPDEADPPGAEQVELQGVLQPGPEGLPEIPAEAGEPTPPPGASLEIPAILWVLGGIGALALLGSVALLVVRFLRP